MLLQDMIRKVFPLPTLLVIAFAPLVFSCLVNNAYTFWYIAMSLGYVVTQNEQIRRFVILVGICVSFTWYTILAWDMVVNGRIFELVYANVHPVMPSLLRFNDETGEVIRDSSTIIPRLIAHSLDLMIHPLSTFGLWYLHKLNGDTLQTVLTLPNCIAAFASSRVWCIVHSWHNLGVPSLYYFGYDVYTINDLTFFNVAYAVETLCILFVIIYATLLKEVKESQQHVEKFSHPMSIPSDYPSDKSIISIASFSDEVSVDSNKSSNQEVVH